MLSDCQALSLHSLDSLVIDEADLILSYGHDEDIRRIFADGYLPKVYQSFLMSATMTDDVETLKGLVLRNPVSPLLTFVISWGLIQFDRLFSSWKKTKTRLQISANTRSGIPNAMHYSYCLGLITPCRCSEVDKFLLTYVILKLRLIKGKCILFVNDVDRSYRLKLFLEQFSIKACVLNSELPLNSRWVSDSQPPQLTTFNVFNRYHTVQEFNKGVYEYIIATDESGAKGEQDSDSDAEVDGEEGAEFDDGCKYDLTSSNSRINLYSQSSPLSVTQPRPKKPTKTHLPRSANVQSPLLPSSLQKHGNGNNAKVGIKSTA